MILSWWCCIRTVEHEPSWTPASPFAHYIFLYHIWHLKLHISKPLIFYAATDYFICQNFVLFLNFFYFPKCFNKVSTLPLDFFTRPEWKEKLNYLVPSLLKISCRWTVIYVLAVTGGSYWLFLSISPFLSFLSVSHTVFICVGRKIAQSGLIT